MTTKSPWEDLFSGIILEALTKTRSGDDSSKEAEFIEQMLQLKPGAVVLDAPCGGGRHSMALASRGYNVTGIDIAQPLLDEATQEATARGLQVNFEYRDMRELPWQNTFDGIFCFWESFGYFDDEGNQAFLEAVFRALKPGGRFLVDTHILETVLPGIRGRDWSRVGESVILEERAFNHIESRLEREWMFINHSQGAAEIERKTLSIRTYSYKELCTLLKQIGFAHCEGYYPLQNLPFQFGAQRLNLVATKP